MATSLKRRSSMESLRILDIEQIVMQLVPDQTISAINFKRNATSKVTAALQQVEKPNMKSSLEDLPNELLLAIFQFLSPCHLHCAFYGLNFRLNELCSALKFHLDLTGPKSILEYYCNQQQPFASLIQSLKLTDAYNRLTLIHQHFDIDIFNQLRVLLLQKPSIENLNRIVLKLPSLPYLSSLTVISPLISLPNVITTIFSIKSLQRLVLDSSQPLVLQMNNRTIQPLTTLNYVSLRFCPVESFLELLKYMGPNVKHMKIDFFYRRAENSRLITQTTIDDLLRGNGKHYQLPVSLLRLHISVSYVLSLQEFHLILTLFRHLKFLTYVVTTTDLYFTSASLWNKFILKNLKKLEKLEFYVHIFGSAVQQCPPPELVYSFHDANSQWLKVPVIMDYNAATDHPTLQFYTYSQSIRPVKTHVEFYGTKRYVAPNNSLINVDENIKELRIVLNDNHQTFSTNQPANNRYQNTYPKVTGITLQSNLSRIPADGDPSSSLIVSEILQSIPVLSNITSLTFTTCSPRDTIYPSKTLFRRLLNKTSKVRHMNLSYDALAYYLESPLITLMLSKQIESLSIRFISHPPSFDSMNRILHVFSTNIRLLHFLFDTAFPTEEFYRFLPLLLCGKCSKLIIFGVGLWQEQQLPFSDEFKSWFNECLYALSKMNKSKFKTIEYEIKDKEFMITF